MHTSKIKSPAGIALFTSLIVAMGAHLYLVNEMIKVKYTSDPASSMCKISDYFNCGASMTSSYSEFLGTPLAIFGIFTQLIILFFAFKALTTDRGEKQATSSQIALTISGFSVLVSLAMAALSVIVIQSLCPFCTLAYICSFITFLAGWKILSPLAGNWSTAAVKGLAFSAIFLFAASFLTGKMIANKFEDKDVHEMLALVVDDWKKQPEKTIELVAPIKSGPDSAKMKIVEFADFLCSHCKAAFPRLKAFVAENKDTQLLFQTFPLDGCAGSFPNVGRQCQLAIASYCAGLQNKGEAGMEYIFNSQMVFVETKDFDKEMSVMAKFINLDSQNFLACTKDNNSFEIVKKQIEAAKKLEVNATPTIFVNNKRYQGAPHPAALQQIYKNL